LHAHATDYFTLLPNDAQALHGLLPIDVPRESHSNSALRARRRPQSTRQMSSVEREDEATDILLRNMLKSARHGLVDRSGTRIAIAKH
jgi:hypothetical protein